jgi:hypothetical protein
MFHLISENVERCGNALTDSLEFFGLMLQLTAPNLPVPASAVMAVAEVLRTSPYLIMSDDGCRVKPIPFDSTVDGAWFDF